VSSREIPRQALPTDQGLSQVQERLVEPYVLFVSFVHITTYQAPLPHGLVPNKIDLRDAWSVSNAGEARAYRARRSYLRRGSSTLKVFLPHREISIAAGSLDSDPTLIHDRLINRDVPWKYLKTSAIDDNDKILAGARQRLCA
jgi:hypothetical protein